MKISVNSVNPVEQSSDCLLLGVFEQNKMSDAASRIDETSNGYLARVMKQGDIEGKAGQTLMLLNVPGIKSHRVLLVGFGKQKELDERKFNKGYVAAIKAAQDSAAKDAICFLTELHVKDRNTAWAIRRAAELAHQSIYAFDQTKSKKDKPPHPLGKLLLNVVDNKDLKTARLAAKIGQAVAKGVNMARELGNLPGNICTPTHLANQATKNTRGIENMTIKVHNQKAIETLGMGSFLSVAKGSREAAKLIVIEYKGGKKTDKPVALVGKGITFDAGGISIKPAQQMDEMKFDMCGAASVLGTMVTLGELQLPVNVVAIVPACENLPDGNANKPGDVVTSMSGQTIEILNTDAEGRLILCDALTYSEKFNPKSVIDVATLTGACVVALGKHPCGLLSNDDALANSLLEAGKQSGDRAWQLPLWDEYQDQLKSNFADIANIGGRDAGTITAACFLSRFTRKLKWAHLDIAGVAWESGSNKGATGRPVPLLSQYLLDQSGKKYDLS